MIFSMVEIYNEVVRSVSFFFIFSFRGFWFFGEFLN